MDQKNEKQTAPATVQATEVAERVEATEATEQKLTGLRVRTGVRAGGGTRWKW